MHPYLSVSVERHETDDSRGLVSTRWHPMVCPIGPSRVFVVLGHSIAIDPNGYVSAVTDPSQVATMFVGISRQAL